MNFQPLLGSDHTIAIQAFAATLAISLSGAHFVLPKGTSVHRCLGYVWVTVIASNAITGLFIPETQIIRCFHLYPSSNAPRFCHFGQADRAAKNGLVSRHRAAMMMLNIFGLLLAGAFTFSMGWVIYAVFTE